MAPSSTCLITATRASPYNTAPPSHTPLLEDACFTPPPPVKGSWAPEKRPKTGSLSTGGTPIDGLVSVAPFPENEEVPC